MQKFIIKLPPPVFHSEKYHNTTTYACKVTKQNISLYIAFSTNANIAFNVTYSNKIVVNQQSNHCITPIINK